jgi:hypothetical protein
MATEPAVRKLRLANNLVNGQPKIRKMKLNRRDVLGEMTLAELSIVDQVWLATRGENVLPLVLGFLLGGFVPIATYVQSHSLPEWGFNPHVLLIAGGLIFSCFTVFSWAQKAFSGIIKAVGFVALIEGTMVFSTATWLGLVALFFLVVINGTATGVNLALMRTRI